jgi:RNA polymerase sigma-70 factor (ECF subfamily)
MAGAIPLGNIAGAFGASAQDATLVSELKAGSEDAYAWLIAQFQQPVYSLVYRILNEPADAADTTQEVFLKVFRGIQRFNGNASLKTWVYRIALHEASNRRRWWFRHKSRETSMERFEDSPEDGRSRPVLEEVLMDRRKSPFENIATSEVQAWVEAELRQVPEPYRSTVILRDIEELTYEEIAEVMEVSLGTVKSRLTRGREALKKRLEAHLPEFDRELGSSLAARSAIAAQETSEASS